MARFVITEEQLNSLIDNAQDPTIGDIIGVAVKSVPYQEVPPPTLPSDPGHDGDGLAGLKRIYRWLNWEMSSWDGHHSEMKKLYNHVHDVILQFDPDETFNECNW